MRCFLTLEQINSLKHVLFYVRAENSDLAKSLNKIRIEIVLEIPCFNVNGEKNFLGLKYIIY